MKHKIEKRIDNLLEEYNKTEEYLNFLKRKLNNIPFLIKRFVKDESEKRELVKYIYWNVDQISKTILYQILNNVEMKDFHKVIQKEFENIVCERCTKPILIKSKTFYKERLQDIKKNREIICKSCKNEIYEERRERSDKEDEIRRKKFQELIEYFKSLPYSEYLKTKH